MSDYSGLRDGYYESRVLVQILRSRHAGLPFRDPGTAISPDQAELRRLCLKQAESEPETFDMSSWMNPADGAGHCLTTRCLAGWAVYLAGEPYPGSDSAYEAVGVRLLGLTRAEYFGPGNVSPLFYDSDVRALRRLRQLCEDLP